jgi:hypothetical protein
VVLPHDRASGGRVAPVSPLAVTLVCDGCRESHEENLRLAYDLGQAFFATERA